MDRKEERDILRKGGLSEGEMKRLSQLRRVHRERMKLINSKNTGVWNLYAGWLTPVN